VRARDDEPSETHPADTQVELPLLVGEVVAVAVAAVADVVDVVALVEPIAGTELMLKDVASANKDM